MTSVREGQLICPTCIVECDHREQAHQDVGSDRGDHDEQADQPQLKAYPPVFRTIGCYALHGYFSNLSGATFLRLMLTISPQPLKPGVPSGVVCRLGPGSALRASVRADPSPPP